MYVLHNKEAHNALRAIAMLVVVTLMLWIVGASPFSQKADASNVTSFSDTLSDSDMNVGSDHTIRFTLPNGAVAGASITVTFPAGFSLGTNTATGLDFNDMDLKDDGVNLTLDSSPAGATWGVATTTSTITFTSGTDVIASSSVVQILVGTHASSGSTGDTRIINPNNAGSYEINISGGTIQDSGATNVAILDNVVVTASVDTSFTFTVNGIATSSAVNGTTTTRTATASTIPFGLLTNSVIQTLGQQLHVLTNAAQGFTVTVYQDQNLLSSTGADIDGFANGNYLDTPGAWSHPTNSISDEKTWGHWGLTTEDDVVAGGGAFGSNQWISASTTPRAIFHHSGPADGTTADIGSTTVGYQVEITSLQEAADDYTTTLTYIATPIF